MQSSPALSHRVLAQLQALAAYVNAGECVQGTWGTPRFARTFLAARRACPGSKSPVGMYFRWTVAHPETVVVTHADNGADSATVIAELTTAGALAQALVEDLQDVAIVVARAAIVDERERALQAEAQARVAAVMHDALVRAAVPA